MVSVAVVSTDDSFRRMLRQTAPPEQLRIVVSLHSYRELNSGAGIDAVILHEPDAEEIESIIDVASDTPLVAAVRTPARWIQDYPVSVVPDDDPVVILAAARAVAAGLVISWPEFEVTGETLKTDNDDLTPREIDVLSLAANGSTNQIIAGDLGISENTVKYHLSGIYAKLGVSRRTEMVFEAIRRGLVSI